MIGIKTYQDLQQNKDRAAFITEAIREHRASAMYNIAVDAEEYDRQRNVTIMSYQKFLYKASGGAVPDNFSANHKMASNFFNRFVTQENQYLLGNGVTLEDEKNKEKLGRDFDLKLQQAGRNALVQGVAFGFPEMQSRAVGEPERYTLRVFKLTEFVPIYDEETGTLMAGIRFWQVDIDKPLRATLYEVDGYTDYIRRKKGAMEVLRPKQTYRKIVTESAFDGVQVEPGRNYPGFPIVPMFGNPHHQSELVGLRENIDSYDLIKSGFANDLDDVSQIYWIMKNSGGMDDVDIVQFLDRVKATRVADIPDGDDGATAEPHTVEVPYSARDVALERLKNDMYDDFQAFNITALQGGQKTATEIDAAYTPLDLKTDQFEYCVLEFLYEMFRLVGIEDNPTFKRNKIQNMNEQTQMVLMAAQYLDDETLLSKLPWLTPEEVQEILKRKDAENLDRFSGIEEDAVEEQAPTQEQEEQDAGINN